MTNYTEKTSSKLYLFLLVIFFTGACTAKVQTDQIEVSDTLRDSSIRYGRLSNGLTYYIRPVSGSGTGTHMELMHRVGASQEDRDQENYPHAIEHLAFKSTKNFPAGIWNSNLLESLGVDNFKAGAGNGKWVTRYSFQVHNGSQSGIEAGLLWFKDIISNLELTSKNVESVRGEVREEFLSKNSNHLNDRIAQAKMESLLFPCENQEEDFLAHHEKFVPASLQKFYENWYHPKFFAVVMVGDIQSVDDMERLIKNRFSKLKSPKTTRKLKDCDSLYHSRPPQFVVVERAKDTTKFLEDKTASIQLFLRNTAIKPPANTVTWLREQVKFQLMLGILRDRFTEATKGYGFNPVMTTPHKNTKNSLGIRLSHSFENGTGARSLQRIGKVLNQLRTHGVLKAEFKDLKEDHRFKLEQERSSQVRYWLDQIGDHYVKDELLPADKHEYISEYLNQLTLDELNMFINISLQEEPEDIGIIAPEGHDALSYNEKEVRLWLGDALNESVEPFKKPEVRDLMTKLEVSSLRPVEYLSKGTNKPDVREYLLNNGIKLVLQKEASGDNRMPFSIKLHGFALGGAKFLPTEDYWSAINAPSIVRHSGVNRLDKFEIDRIESRRGLLPGAVTSYIDYSEHGIYGTSSLESMETMMQMVYLFFTKPNKSKEAFNDWKLHQTKTYLNYPGDLVTTDFLSTVRSITGDKQLSTSFYKKNPPGGTEGYNSLEKTNFEKALSIYSHFFNDAKDFTFLITGNFEEEQVLRLAQKYLGNLPTSNSLGEISESSRELPKGPTYQVISNKANYKLFNVGYGTLYIQKAEDIFDWKEHMKIEALGEVVRQKAWDLRFIKGYGLYDVNARGIYNADLQRYEVATYLYCQPKDFPQLQKEMRRIYSEIRDGEISDSELTQGLDLLHYFHFSERAHIVGMPMNKLYLHYRYDQPLTEEEQVEKYTMNLSIDDIQEVAQKYLKEENFHEIVIREN